MKSTKTHSGIFMGITGLLNVTQLISSQPLHALIKIHCGLKSVLQVCTAACVWVAVETSLAFVNSVEAEAEVIGCFNQTPPMTSCILLLSH